MSEQRKMDTSALSERSQKIIARAADAGLSQSEAIEIALGLLDRELSEVPPEVLGAALRMLKAAMHV